MTNGTSQLHFSEGEIVRLLDGEMSFVERLRARSHLSECRECQARRAALVRGSRRATEALEALDPLPVGAPAAASRRRVPSVSAGPLARAAAVLLVALTVTAILTPPLRAWIADQWESVVARVAGAEPALPEAPPVAPRDGTAVAFPVVGRDFRIEVAHPQTVGEVVLQVHEGTRAVAEVVSGDGEEALTVLPGSLLIGNTAGSAASYRILVPADLETVTVRVGAAFHTVEVGRLAPESERRIPLGGG